MDINTIFKKIQEIPRRGGNQTEGFHVICVRTKLIDLIQNHGIYPDNPSIAGDIAIVHDIREIGLPKDVVKSMETLCTPEVLEGLDILSRKEGESSTAHFERVLASGNKDAIAVKWADCMANAEYTDAEAKWHDEYFEYSYAIDQEKYLDRANQLLDVLKSM